MKRYVAIIAVLALAVAPAFATGGSGTMNGTRSTEQQVGVNISQPATTSTSPTWTSITSAVATVGTVDANTERIDCYAMNYSTAVVYAYTVGTATQTVVDKGILIPGYSTSNTNWKVQLPYYTGAWYFVNADIIGKNLRVVEFNK